MTAAATPPASASPKPAGEFRSLRRVARVTCGLIVLCTVVGVVDMLVRGTAYVATGVLLAAPDWLPLQHVYPRVNDWGRGPLAEIERVLIPTRSVWYGIMLVAGLAFLHWLGQAAANLRALGTPSVRARPSWAVASFVVLLPALFAVHEALDGWARPLAATAVVVACMVGPYHVVRRLWLAGSGLGGPDGPRGPIWEGVRIWWAAFTVFWISSRLAVSHPLEGTMLALANGVFELVAGVSLATAAVLIVRIMSRVNAMQELLARTLPTPPAPDTSEKIGEPTVATVNSSEASPDPPAPVVPPARHAAVRWQCRLCEYSNPTALRFCQSCAAERR